MKKIGFLTTLVVVLLTVPLTHEIIAGVYALILNHLPHPDQFESLLSVLPVSSVYSGLFIETVSQIQPLGISLQSGLGDWFYQLLPAVFLKPGTTVNDTGVSLVIAAGSTPLARLVVHILTEVSLASGAWLLIKRAIRTQRANLLIGGLALLSQSLLSLYRLPLTDSLLEDMGLNFVVGPAINGQIDLYDQLLNRVVPAVFYLGLTLLVLWPGLWYRQQIRPHWRPAAAVLVLIFLLRPVPAYFGLVPQGVDFSLIRETSAPVAAVPNINSVVAITHPEVSLPIPTIVSTTKEPPKITVIRNETTVLKTTINLKADGQFQLLIDGSPATVRGVQYYFGPLTKQSGSEKEKIWRRDLAIIRQAGFDTVMGWEEEGFDQRFLALAQEYDLKVIKPFLLKTNASTDYFWVDKNFLDPNLRATLKAEFREKIERNKNSPAILFWNIGADEPLERIHSYYRRDPRLIYDEGFKAQVDAQRQATADLILELAVLAHQVDPRHPVIVSEPRYWHWPFYQEAIRKIRLTGIDPSNFLIYGANFYSEARWGAEFQRVKDETQAVKIMAAVTEWAPFGVDRNLRPYFRAKMSREIMKITPISVVYVFNPAADPLDGMPDPTQAIISGLSLTDMERGDANGLLSAIAETLDRPLFSTALDILQADRERGLNGVPLGSAIPQEDSGPSLYFAGTDTQGQKVAYRWRLLEKSNRLDGPEIVTEVPFLNQGSVTILGKTFLPTYLERGGPAFFGQPLGNVYETVFNGQRVFRQDFSQGHSLVIPVP